VKALSLLALMLAAAGPALAGGMSEEGRIFHQVCLANAPELGQAAIEEAARSVRYKGGSVLGAGGVEYEPGKRCKTAFPVSGGPDDKEVERMAVEFAPRLNGKLRLKKSAIGGARWYEIRVGRVKYGIEGGVSSGARYFTISKR
jgi:hypothetical protein